MKISILCIYIALILSQSDVFAQNIDNVSSLRSHVSEKEIRFFYDNDFFSAQDYYYTQGINLQYVHPIIKDNPINFLLIKSGNGNKIYGLSIEHNVFTPSSIRHEEVLLNDHPFSAFMLLKSFVRSKNEKTGDVLSSAFSIGFIGPAAYGKEMQTSIHRWLKNLLPLGWDHQIQNDLILNYQFSYEKMFVRAPGTFHLAGIATLNAGTLLDDISAGLQFRVGKFYESSDKKSAFYIYGRSQVYSNFYDATLNGGVFNNSNEYVLSPDEINRFTVQHTIGINIKLRKIALEYFQSFVTKEFNLGMNHRYGGISIGYCF